MDGNQDMTQSLITVKTEYRSALARRGHCNRAVAEAEIHAAADAADVLACEGHLITLGRSRAAAIAAAKPTAVIAVDAELLRASVVREIAAARSLPSTAKHAEAVTASRDAETAVTQAAKAVIDSEMVDKARAFTAALDAALAIGEQLRELAHLDGQPSALGAPSRLPPEVERALERLPKQNPYDTPLHILRNGSGSSGAWKRRLAELTAESIVAESIVDVA
jgi:hypothetical protein